MGHKDYYKILGISKDSSAREIKGAYRKLALKYHPDTIGGRDDAGERFKEINEAFTILGDETSRKDYDLRGQRPLDGAFRREGVRRPMNRRASMGPCGSFGCRRKQGMAACFSNKGSSIGKAFRHPFSKYHQARNAVYEIRLTPDEALNGAEKVVPIGRGSTACELKVKTQSNLKNGDFLIMKNGSPWQKGKDIYFRVALAEDTL
jgi:DnaJ-class molecular chaperone